MALRHDRGRQAEWPRHRRGVPHRGAALSDLWRDLREALRGSSQDFTDGPLARAVLLLAVPMVVEMSMESLFAIADVFWVSRLGPDAVATVGLTEAMLTMVYTVAMGLSISVTATVARRIGEGDAEAAGRTAVQGIVVGMALATLLGIAGVILAPDLLRLMGAQAGVVASGAGYTRVLLGGEVTVILLFLLNAAFRGAGDAAIAMRVLIVSNVLNIVLAPCFIFGLGPFPRLGVTGAAVATTLGRGIGVVLQVATLVSGRGRMSLARRHVTFDLGAMWRLLQLAAPATFQVFVGTASWIGLTRVLARFGSDALAGYTIGIRVIVFAILPAVGLANAAATMVGQSLGAGKPDRAEAAVWLVCRYNLVFLGSGGVLLLLLAPVLVGIFTDVPAVAETAVRCLRIVALGFPFYGFGMVLTEAFNGAGDTVTPTLVNLGIFWAFEVPLAAALAEWSSLGPTSVFVAITIAFSSLALVSAVLFRRGRWRTRTV